MTASRGSFHFKVATPAGRIPDPPVSAQRPGCGATSGASTPGRTSPRSRSGSIQAPRTRIVATSSSRPEYGPLQNGPEILDSQGHLIWFKSAPGDWMATVVRVQKLYGKTVLTWWQGKFGAGVGAGEDVINDDHYQQIAVVRAGNGLYADLHDFVITPQNTALMAIEEPVRCNASSVGQPTNQVVFNSVVQEIDIPTGLVLFQWDSLDHIPLRASYTKFHGANHPYDYFHLNSVFRDRDGNIILSGRSVSSVYKIALSNGHMHVDAGGQALELQDGARRLAGLPARRRPAISTTSSRCSTTAPGCSTFTRNPGRCGCRLDFHNHTASEQKRDRPLAVAAVELRGQRSAAAGRPHLRRLGPSAVLQRVQRLAARTSSTHASRTSTPAIAPIGSAGTAIRRRSRRWPPRTAHGRTHGLRELERRHRRAQVARAGGLELAQVASGGDGQADKLRDRDPDLSAELRAVQALTGKGHVLGTSSTIRAVISLIGDRSPRTGERPQHIPQDRVTERSGLRHGDLSSRPKDRS